MRTLLCALNISHRWEYERDAGFWDSSCAICGKHKPFM